MNEKKEAYLAKIEAGMSYDQLRVLAKSDGIKNEELVRLMRELDDVLLQKNEKKAIQEQGKEWMWVGISFCLIAMIMLLYSFFDPESVYVYIVYAVFFGGILVFFTGWQKRKTAIEEEGGIS